MVKLIILISQRLVFAWKRLEERVLTNLSDFSAMATKSGIRLLEKGYYLNPWDKGNFVDLIN